MSREMLQQALDAFKTCRVGGYTDADGDWCVRLRFDESQVNAAVKDIEAEIDELRTKVSELEIPPPPHECKTEAEKTAYAFGWWKALETARPKREALFHLRQYGDVTQNQMDEYLKTGKISSAANSPNRQPMSIDEIDEVWASAGYHHDFAMCHLALVRAVEKHHGISKE